MTKVEKCMRVIYFLQSELLIMSFSFLALVLDFGERISNLEGKSRFVSKRLKVDSDFKLKD